MHGTKICVLLTPRKPRSDCVMTASCVQLNSSMYATKLFARCSNDGVVRKNAGNSSRSLRMCAPEENDICSARRNHVLAISCNTGHTFTILILIYLWDVPKMADLCNWFCSNRTATAERRNIRWLWGVLEMVEECLQSVQMVTLLWK